MTYLEEHLASVSHKFSSEELEELKKILELPKAKWILKERLVTLDSLLEGGLVGLVEKIDRIFSQFGFSINPENNEISHYLFPSQCFPSISNGTLKTS